MSLLLSKMFNSIIVFLKIVLLITQINLWPVIFSEL